MFSGSFIGGDGGAALTGETGLTWRWHVLPNAFLSVSPRYPLIVYDDHPYDGLFWTGAIGVRM